MKFLFLVSDKRFEDLYGKPIYYYKVIGKTFKKYEINDVFVKKVNVCIDPEEGVFVKEAVLLKVVEITDLLVKVEVVK